MSLLLPANPTPTDLKQSRLLQMAAVFLLLYAVILSLAPAVRLHSWAVEYRWNHWIGFITWLVGAALVHRELIRRLPDRDPYLFPIGALLAGWGLLTIWRLDMVMGARQTAWLAVCFIAFAGGLRIPNALALLRRYKYLWLTGGLLLTALTFIIGTYPGGLGPRLWLGCCGLYLMPSEPLKLLLIAYLAAYLADRLSVGFGWMQLLTPTLLLVGAALGLLVSQRDLGTASLFILIYTVVVYIASNRKRTLVISALVLLAAGVTGYLLFDVVRIRVDAWINPWLDPSGRSYQIIQSIISVASGEFLGRGPGMGSPGVVPVSHSDFIFAAVAEETGLVGSVGLLALFALLVERGFRSALYAASNYRRYMAAGITAYLTIQACFIIGGNLRLLPLTGVTLPFVSYGGSSLLTAFIALFILLLTSGRNEEDPAPLPSATPYLVIGGGLLLALAALAVVSGWWGEVRRDTLLARPENPRRVITDRYVPRGALLDRSGAPINNSSGQPGSFQRTYNYAPLSATTGYTSPIYGQAGLESGLDGLLRGLEGNPESLVWVDNLLYGQPPPGVDVRLTLDLEIQKQADAIMDGHKGALVLLDAGTGEILAMASRPYFEPSQVDGKWDALIHDPDAPLINRATQGRYPPGAALGPFLFAYANTLGEASGLTLNLSETSASGGSACALPLRQSAPLASAVSAGCPGSLGALSRRLDTAALTSLFTSLGFYQSPTLPLAVAEASPAAQITAGMLDDMGQTGPAVTPLQMALAAAALTNAGARPIPQLTSAVLTPQSGWQPTQRQPAIDTVMAGGAAKTVEQLRADDLPYWQTVALARSNQTELTWYLAGTLPDRTGSPLALVLILEENDPAKAQAMGQSLLNALLK